jgi:hypothetical protein
MLWRPTFRTQNHAALFAGGGAPPSYDTDAQAYFDAIVTNGGADPDSTRKTLIDGLVTGLKSDSIWTKITALYLFAAHDSVAARVNLKTPATVASAVNSPTFTTDRGYTGDAVSAHVDSGLTASTLTRTDATIFAICNTLSNTSLSPVIGWNANTAELRLDGNTLSSNRARIGATNSTAPTTQPLADHFVAGRRTGTSQDIVVETSVEGASTATDSSTGATAAIYFLRVGTAYGDSQISIGGWGVYLNDTEAANLRTRLRTYCTGVGVI